MSGGLPAMDASLLVVAAVAAACDLRSGRISNWLTLPALLAGVAVHGWIGGLVGVSIAVLGALLTAAPAWVLFRHGGMGGGDVKLLSALGALAGAERGLEIFFGAILVAIFAIVLKHVWRGTLLSVIGHGAVELCSAVARRWQKRPVPVSPLSSATAATFPFGAALGLAAAALILQERLLSSLRSIW